MPNNKAVRKGSNTHSANLRISRKGLIMLGAAAIAVIVALTAILIAAIGTGSQLSDNEVVAYVGEYPLYAGELRLAIEAVRSDTVMYFIDTYGATQGNDFWESEYGGESTREALLENALAHAAKYKREQIMLLDYGIIKADDMSYKAFYREFIAENRDRAQADKNGEIIYGPVQYTEQGYYDYLHNNRIMDLRWAVNEKLTGGTELTYEKENFEQQYAEHYADIEVKRVDKAISQIKAQ